MGVLKIPSDKLEPKLKPEFLEILAHPLRQEILVYIEQEGETGYKDLKNKFNVATGTLYHHLRFLKGLIEQNSNKKYILTEEGVKALDVIFQENSFLKPRNQTIQESQFEKTETKQSNESIATNESNQSIELDESIPIINKSGNDSTPIVTHEQLQNQTHKYSDIQFFNINKIVNAIPSWFYQSNLLFFFILPGIIFLINPKIVFFHFIPILIKNSLYVTVIFIFPLFNLIILFVISIIKKERISLPTIGLLAIYYNSVFILTVITNFFSLSTNDLYIKVLSIIIQGLFIIFWTMSVSLQYYSWERALFFAIIQNYMLFLFF